jgi:hypothetical protein
MHPPRPKPKPPGSRRPRAAARPPVGAVGGGWGLGTGAAGWGCCLLSAVECLCRCTCGLRSAQCARTKHKHGFQTGSAVASGVGGQGAGVLGANARQRSKQRATRNALTYHLPPASRQPGDAGPAPGACPDRARYPRPHAQTRRRRVSSSGLGSEKALERCSMA